MVRSKFSRLSVKATWLFVALAAASSALADPKEEHWSAASTTAIGITGDITLSPDRLTAAGKAFPLAVEADVTDFDSDQGPRAARILQVTTPVNPVLKNGNTLCGDRVRWIVVYRSDHGRSLDLSAFSGARRPTSESGPDLCATFLYVR